MLVVGFPTGWGRRVGGIRSKRCGEKQLEQRVIWAVVAALGLLLPRLKKEARSRQRMSKVVRVVVGLSVRICIFVDFISGCDTPCFLGEGWVEGNTWEGKKSHCPSTIGQILTHQLFPMLKSGKSHAFGHGWSLGLGLLLYVHVLVHPLP